MTVAFEGIVPTPVGDLIQRYAKEAMAAMCSALGAYIGQLCQ